MEDVLSEARNVNAGMARVVSQPNLGSPRPKLSDTHRRKKKSEKKNKSKNKTSEM